jgi:hypothetical protein
LNRRHFNALTLLAAASGYLVYQTSKSPYVTRAFEARKQPIQFSHERHVAGNGLDCRYCHTSVESEAVAGIPPTKTSMNCHAQIHSGSPYLEPVRSSYAMCWSPRWRWWATRFVTAGAWSLTTSQCQPSK